MASLQFAQHDQPRIKHGVTADIQGTLIKIDSNADARSRLWIRLDAVSNIVKSGILPVGGIVRVITDKWQDQQYLGGAVSMRARLYPRPDRILHGAPDYGWRARVDDVLASGYVIAQIAMMPNNHAGTIKHDMTMALARLRRRCLLAKDGSSARRYITGFAILAWRICWPFPGFIWG